MADERRYRSKESYVSKDPAKRAKQMANLKGGRHGNKKRKDKIAAAGLGADAKDVDKYKDDIVGFAESHFFITESRKPIKLLDWQKIMLRAIFHEDKTYSMALLGMCKKSGKSTIAAMIALWMLLNRPFAEVFVLGPDLQQGTLVIFDKICKSVRMHPLLRDICKIRTDTVQYGDSTIMVLPCSKTNAGLNPDCVIIDEAWQFETTEAKRTIDELTNVPTKNMLTLVTTYAGYEDSEDSHLWQWYQAGLNGTDPDMYFIWRVDYTDVPWVTAKYLETQKLRLRENTYLRLHENQWTSSEQAFISAAVLDACTISDYSRGTVPKGRVTIGVDIGLKHDTSAIAIVGSIDDETLGLVDHAVFVPVKGQTLDLEKTVEAALLVYQKTFDIAAVFYDPYQFARSAKTMQTKGLPMREYPQTQANTVLMSETLSGLLNNQNFWLYEDADVRTHLLNAQAKETQRGYRIVKRRESQKIDLAVALAMAAQAAQESFLLKAKADIVWVGDDAQDAEDAYDWKEIAQIGLIGEDW